MKTLHVGDRARPGTITQSLMVSIFLAVPLARYHLLPWQLAAEQR
jgi:hypothetical protein